MEDISVIYQKHETNLSCPCDIQSCLFLLPGVRKKYLGWGVPNNAGVVLIS